MKLAPEHQHDHKDHTVSRMLTGLAIGGAVLAAGVVLAPHILPALGIGGEEVFADMMSRPHTYIASEALSITEAGSGIAGVLNRGIANFVPFIGEKLAEGGLFNAIVSASIGAGGFLLGRSLEKKHKGEGFNWGKALKIGSLITSALVALPVLLTGITMGVTYLAMLTGNNAIIDNTVGIMNHTLGVAGSKMSSSFLGFSGLAGGIAHLFTCGASALPLGLSVLAMRDRKKSAQGKMHEDAGCGHDGPAISDKATFTLESEKPLEVGVRQRVKLRLTSLENGKPIPADDLRVVETKKLHLFLVDSSLKDYQHIHPVDTDEPGVYSFSFTPQTSNSYAGWSDFVIAKGGEHHRIKSAAPLKGKRDMAPSIRTNTRAEVDDMVFEWRPRESLTSGKETMVDVIITDKAGKPIEDLEQLMGTFSSLAGFHTDGKSILHSHPAGAHPKNAAAPGGPVLQFHVHPDTSGPTQFFVQVQRDGKEIYAPFGQLVKGTERAEDLGAASMAR